MGATATFPTPFCRICFLGLFTTLPVSTEDCVHPPEHLRVRVSSLSQHGYVVNHCQLS